MISLYCVAKHCPVIGFSIDESVIGGEATSYHHPGSVNLIYSNVTSLVLITFCYCSNFLNNFEDYRGRFSLKQAK